MAVDTPAKIAILGAGPLGLEAALYARFLGYDVDIYDQGSVAHSVERWGHVRMFSPFGMNRSPLAVAALEAQGYRDLPADDELLTGHEYRERFLLPLAHSDLLEPHLHLHTEVIAVGRDLLLKGDLPGHEDRGDDEFRLLVQSADGSQRIELADVVFDCTGTFTNPLPTGQGGITAPGEQPCGAILRHLPDVLGADRRHFAGRTTLLVGSGYSAATAAVALGKLAEDDPQTQFLWAVRRPGSQPLASLADDPLPARAALVAEANRLATSGGACQFHAGRGVAQIEPLGGDRYAVELSGEPPLTVEVDQILSLTGYRPQTELFRELQVHLCYATEGPMKLAAALIKHASADCLNQPATEAETLLNPEPHFYVLGSKSYGRNSQFLIATGLDQIRQVFTIIGERDELNLYTSIRSGLS